MGSDIISHFIGKKKDELRQSRSRLAKFGNVRSNPDLVTSQLAALHFFQLAIPAPKPPVADAQVALGNLREVIGKLVFVDDENMFPIRLNKPQVAKSLHEQADPRPSRTHHLGQFIVRYL